MERHPNLNTPIICPRPLRICNLPPFINHPYQYHPSTSTKSRHRTPSISKSNVNPNVNGNVGGAGGGVGVVGGGGGRNTISPVAGNAGGSGNVRRRSSVKSSPQGQVWDRVGSPIASRRWENGAQAQGQGQGQRQIGAGGEREVVVGIAESGQVENGRFPTQVAELRLTGGEYNDEGVDLARSLSPRPASTDPQQQALQEFFEIFSQNSIYPPPQSPSPSSPRFNILSSSYNINTTTSSPSPNNPSIPLRHIQTRQTTEFSSPPTNPKSSPSPSTFPKDLNTTTTTTPPPPSNAPHPTHQPTTTYQTASLLSNLRSPISRSLTKNNIIRNRDYEILTERLVREMRGLGLGMGMSMNMVGPATESESEPGHGRGGEIEVRNDGEGNSEVTSGQDVVIKDEEGGDSNVDGGEVAKVDVSDEERREEGRDGEGHDTSEDVGCKGGEKEGSA